MTNQEIAAGLARQEAWNCVFIAVTLKMHELRTANGSALEAIGSPEWRRLDAQQTAVWEASAGDATPEEMEQAKAAVREHAPELCDVLGIGWPVEFSAPITEPRAATALHEAALAAKTPKPSEPYFLHIVSDPGPHQPLAVLLAEHETSGINASGFLDLADVEEIYPMRNGQAQVVANGTDLILSAASAIQVCNELDVNVGERFAWRLAAAEAKAKVATELFVPADVAMQHLAGLCDCEAGSGCDRARIREQLRVALDAARAAGIGSDDNRAEAKQ